MDLHVHHHFPREPRRTGALALAATALTVALALCAATPKSARTKLNDLARAQKATRPAYVAMSPADQFMASLGAPVVPVPGVRPPDLSSGDIAPAIRRTRRAF